MSRARYRKGPRVHGSGFSIAELLVGLALVLCATALLLPVTAGGLRLTAAQPEVADLDQRQRVLSTVVRAALEHAGLGPAAGPDTGTLALRIPAVFPQRRGIGSSDPPDTARPDAITVLAGRRGVAAALAVAMATPAAPLAFDTGPPCPPLDARCGFRAGQTVLVDDRGGAFDLLRIGVAEPGVLAGTPETLSRAYGPGEAARAQAIDVTQLRFDAVRRQLRIGDGLGVDMPLVDEVAAVSIEYYGQASPPVSPRPPLGHATCLFGADGTPLLPDLAGSVGGLVRLGLDMLADGPFCGTGASRHDADLLRIRRVVFRTWLAPLGGARHRTAEGVLAPLISTREVVVDVTLRNVPFPS